MMKSHTKRIRKARRQGLASKKPGDLAPPTRRMQFRGSGMEARDLPGETRATERRETVATKRKGQRRIRGMARRATTRRVR